MESSGGSGSSQHPPRKWRVDAAHGAPGTEPLSPAERLQLDQISGWDPHASLQQLHQQARELAEKLRDQQRRLTLRQAELDVRALQWATRRESLHRQRQVASDNPSSTTSARSDWAQAVRSSLGQHDVAGIELDAPYFDALHADSSGTLSVDHSLSDAYARSPGRSSGERPSSSDQRLATVHHLLSLCDRVMNYLEHDSSSAPSNLSR
ncbi:MAG: hypothetical protein U0795_16535 [Pirellulales bacterium]